MVSRYSLIVLVVALCGLLACSPSLSLTDLKYNEINGATVLCWTTSEEAQCQVTWCDGELCYWSDLEPNYSKLHQYVIYERVTSITIIGEDRCGAQFQYDMGVVPPTPTY